MKNKYPGVFTEISIDQVRSGAFLLALCLYAFRGSPTPDTPGLVEVVIAAFLVMAVGLVDAAAALRVDMKAPLWRSAGQALLIYGLSVPVIMSVLRGAEISQALRDVFPFLFLLLPVFMGRLCGRYEGAFRAVLCGALVIGVVFAVRAGIDVQYDLLALLFPARGAAELNYFANAPTVLFAALFIAGYSAQRFFEHYTFKAFLLFFLGCALATILLFPVALTAQRASLGYAVLYAVILTGIAFYKAPYRALIIAVSVIVFLAPFYSTALELIHMLAQKTSLVGFNARFEELAAVWAEISKSASTIAFGAGWGGSFESPAVAEIRVNYTHSLLTSALLKTGIVGVILVIFYLFGLAQLLWGFLRRNPVLALALAGPIVIDVFLYASFKSLDFGLVLLLIPAYVLSRAEIAKA